MTLADALHYTGDHASVINNSYPKHVRRARADGLPAIGEGAVWPILDEDISLPPFPVPRHWLEIGGLDFGYDHPTAACRLVIDPETRLKVLVATYRQRLLTPLQHVSALKDWGRKLPFAWGVEGHQKKLSDDPKTTADMFRGHGLHVLDTHATFETGGVGVEQGVQEMLEEFEKGTLKVVNTLLQFFEEKSAYHRRRARDDGKAEIYATMNDILDAFRYAYMMRRYAIPVSWRDEMTKRPTNYVNAPDTRDIF